MKLFQRKTTSELRDEIEKLREKKEELNTRTRLDEEKAKLQAEIRAASTPVFIKSMEAWLKKNYGKRR